MTPIKGHFGSCNGAGPCACKAKRYGALIVITTGLFLFELWGSYFTGSLALYADALHVAQDNLPLIMGFLIALAEWRDTSYKRAVRLEVLAVVILLAALSIRIGWEAMERLYDFALLGTLPEVQGASAAAIAVVTLGGNLAQHAIHDRAAPEQRDHLHHGVHAHIWSDLLQSAAVILSSLLIWFFGWHLADPLCSLVIALWILLQIPKVLREVEHEHD